MPSARLHFNAQNKRVTVHILSSQNMINQHFTRNLAVLHYLKWVHTEIEGTILANRPAHTRVAYTTTGIGGLLGDSNIVEFCHAVSMQHFNFGVPHATDTFVLEPFAPTTFSDMMYTRHSNEDANICMPWLGHTIRTQLMRLHEFYFHQRIPQPFIH